MDYKTDVQVRNISKEELMEKYCFQEQFMESCRLCPYYDRRWSCPPGLPDALCYLEHFSSAYLIAVKVAYSDEIRNKVTSAEEAEYVRQESYEVVKRKLLLALLELEKMIPAGKSLGAGRCILCEHCTREEGKPCRYPQRRRYSITGFGFDFTGILKDLFGITLLWSTKGLPEYDVAVAAFFT